MFLCQVLFTTLCAQEKKYSPEIELKIKAVENNLGLWVRIDGDPNHTLKERMNFYHVNGVSIAIIKDYKIEWARGYGWADSVEQRRVTTGTLFQAGSISKSLNGVGVLKMVQDKRLNLYADVNDYLMTWKFPYDSLSESKYSLSKSKKVTLANLLSHTAGLNVHGFPGYERGDSIPSLIQVLEGKKPANTSAVRSAFEPGLKFQYSGGGTTISQLILQDITRKPYDLFMWENVLKPMGMKNSFYTQPPSEEKQKLLASGYYNDGKEIKGKYHIYPEQAAAGLWTNPTDLAYYTIETQLALQGKSNKVLSQEMTKLRLTPYIDNSAALGVFIIKKGEQTYFQHTGVDEGFVSQYYGSMEGGNGVVVMANTYNTAILDEIINSVATVYEWKGFYNPVQRPKIITVPQANTFPPDGNVGVGTTTPGYKLDVNGTGNFVGRLTGTSATFGGNITSGNGRINSARVPYSEGLVIATNGIGYGGITFHNTSKSTDALNASTYKWGLVLGYSPPVGTAGNDLIFNYGNSLELLRLSTSGNVGIGTTTPGEKLAVNGTILAKEVKVKLSASPSWPNFVFKPAYKLTSLPDLEKYIQQNQRLPGIPSAAEVEEDGIKLGEMNAKLLQKIEELTLYMINFKKEMELMKTENQSLKADVAQLKANK